MTHYENRITTGESIILLCFVTIFIIWLVQTTGCAKDMVATDGGIKDDVSTITKPTTDIHPQQQPIVFVCPHEHQMYGDADPSTLPTTSPRASTKVKSDTSKVLPPRASQDEIDSRQYHVTVFEGDHVRSTWVGDKLPTITMEKGRLVLRHERTMTTWTEPLDFVVSSRAFDTVPSEKE